VSIPVEAYRGAPIGAALEAPSAMELTLALLGATGVVVAIAANLTNIARFVNERRRDAAKPGRAGAARNALLASAQPGIAVGAGTLLAPVARPARPAIRTPDQRVRVFVSSTLRELADERAAVRRAIEGLRLTPVMFELGARPHPPRDVYRAYLEQSDVFVAVYGQQYGWIAPGETVSGLEDEYALSAGMPRLVYVRRADGPREERLEALLARVRDDDAASYTPFTTPDELAELLGDDLAVLLSERFARESLDPSAAAPPLAAAALPAPQTSFVGRGALLDELASMLLRRDVHLLTLVGPGGAGKSRIAIELAARTRHAFAGDVIYVSLATVRDPALVASSLAIALGVRATGDADSVQAMQRVLAHRSGLLVVDNFEHLVDAAPVIAELLRAAPALTILVTSRSVLHLSQEVAFPIPPLDLPADADAAPEELLQSESVRLFVDRARAVDPRFELDADNAAAVVEICRRVDALPLAIELAAARLRSLPPGALLARMSRRLPLLTGGPRDAPERQRTLRDAIAWSVALLEPHEQAAFARFSLFDGGASLRHVERVLGDAGATFEALTALVDHSLVQRDGDGDEDRLSMLETVREYAAELLATDPENAVLRDRHARVYLELAEEGGAALKGADQARWGRWLVRDLGNLRGAMASFLEAGDAPEALRLATALRPLFMARCHYEEGRRMLEAALDLGQGVGGRVRAAALFALGALRWRAGDLAAALPPLQESLATYRRVGDAQGEAETLRLLGVHAHNAGDYDLAQRRLEEALASMRALGSEEGVGNTLLSLGNVAFDRGEPRAQALYQESLAIARRIGDTLGVAYALDNLGVLAWCRGDLGAASRHTEAAAELYHALDHRFGLASVLHRRGLLALARDDTVDAEAHLTRSLRLRSEIGEGRGCAFVRYDLGRAALAAGRPSDARAHFRLGLEQAEHHGGPLVEALYLEGTAALAATEGQATAAAELLAAADAWRRAARVPVCRSNQERHAALHEALRARLDGAARSEAERVGQGWTLPQAVARARALLLAPASGAA
jgi:predicted ATPase